MTASSLSFDSADWPAPPQVRALTTNRVGGISRGSCDSLNLGDHVGDDLKAVLANRQLLRQSLQLPQEPRWLTQVHGTRVVEFDEKCSADQSSITADGAIADAGAAVCVVMTADCMPVFICDTSGQQIGVVHAGWRGLAAGIVEHAIAKFRADPSEILVWAGPTIGPTNFEVGMEVQQELGGSNDCYLPHRNADKVYANLYQVLAEKLLGIGVASYTFSSACTYNDADKYFSYRRDGQCGRMASLIWVDQ